MRRGRIGTKINKTSETTAAANAPVVPTTSDPSHAENNVIEKMSEMTIREPDVSSDNMALVVYVEPSTVLNSNGNDNSTVDSLDDFSWLDYAILQQVIEASEIESNGLKETPPSTDDYVLQEVIEASKADSNGLTETPTLADVSWLDYAKPSSSSNDHNMASNAEDGTDVLQEEEPKLIQQSEVILLPYEELNSTSNGNGVVSSSTGYEKEETSDIDGFGGLFDEPEEVVYGPALSVDKCLAYFTASELLTKTEHAWHCEQCSKALIEQKNKLQECVSNGAENGNSNICISEGPNHCCKDRDTYKYRLIGVVEHLGTMRGGNYVAYLRGPAAKGNNDCVWHHTSDAHVNQVSFEEVLRCEAYILFYEEIWPPRVTLGRLLPHARGLGFKPRRGGFPSGAKKEWGLSSRAKVRVLHTAQLDVTVSSNH
ncbi:ubiquitin carboxyl-terminal hydrolase 2-like protein [Tanacetum coccineum]